VKGQDVALLLALGLIIWIAGTIYYANHGRAILETTSFRYWTAFALSPIVSAVLCIAILRWRHIVTANWTSAMLLLAIPGMIGEAVVFPTSQPSCRSYMPRPEDATEHFCLPHTQSCLEWPRWSPYEQHRS
jgi:cytochrome bd-type quinol oxidase subunit 2